MTISKEDLYRDVIDGIKKTDAGQTIIVAVYAWAWKVHAVRITPIFRAAEKAGLIERGYRSSAGNIVWRRTNV